MMVMAAYHVPYVRLPAFPDAGEVGTWSEQLRYCLLPRTVMIGSSLASTLQHIPQHGREKRHIRKRSMPRHRIALSSFAKMWLGGMACELAMRCDVITGRSTALVAQIVPPRSSSQ